MNSKQIETPFDNQTHFIYNSECAKCVSNEEQRFFCILPLKKPRLHAADLPRVANK